MHCLLVLTFHFPIFRKSECKNPTIKHISTYTLSCLKFILAKYSHLVFRTQLHLLYLQQTSRTLLDIQLDVYKCVENSSSLFFQISCSHEILNTSRMSYSLLSRYLAYMYLSQLMRTFTNYLKCIVFLS